MLTGFLVLIKISEVEIKLLCEADVFAVELIFVLFNVMLMKLLVGNIGFDEELYIVLEEVLKLFKTLVVVLYLDVIIPDNRFDVSLLNPLEVIPGTVLEFDII